MSGMRSMRVMRSIRTSLEFPSSLPRSVSRILPPKMCTNINLRKTNSILFARFMSSSTREIATNISASSSPMIDVKIEPSNILELMELHCTTITGTIFSDTGPVVFTADLLCSLKDIDGLSWIQVILYTTVVMRLLTGLPIAIAQQRALQRLEEIKPNVLQLAEDLKKETGVAIRKFGWDEKTAKRQFHKSYKKHWRKLMEEHNCHPLKSIGLTLIQIPIWICFSSALRNIVFGLPLPRTEEQAQRWYEMFQEGTPWIENLTVSDPFVLPAIFLTANLANIYIHSRNPPLVRSKLQTALPWIFSGGIVFISVLACYVPSAVTIYWTTSSSVALTQNVLLMHPGLRKALKMHVVSPHVPQTPSIATKFNK